GVRSAQVEAPGVKFHRQTVGQVDRLGLRLVVCAYAREDRLRLRGKVAVDLPARREESHALPDERRERLAALADHREHQEPGDHAAVAVGELAEVMEGAHLPAVRGIDLAHLLLDGRVYWLAQ